MQLDMDKLTPEDRNWIFLEWKKMRKDAPDIYDKACAIIRFFDKTYPRDEDKSAYQSMVVAGWFTHTYAMNGADEYDDIIAAQSLLEP